VTGAALTWLNTVRCTAPFTLDDARELYKLIKYVAAPAFVDVFTRVGDKVFIRIETARGVLERTIDVV
jgi:hypothetical protein